MNKKSAGNTGHVPVLLDPVINGLNIHPDGCYVDGTFGRGGHSAEILERLGPAGRLIGIDRDPAAVAAAVERFGTDPRFEIVKGEIAQLEDIATDRQLLGKVDGLLLDLGVSSPQLDEAERGFSFQHDGPLDMRMDPQTGISAADWIASVDEKEMKQVLYRLGEEKSAPRIAKAIIAARAVQPIERTSQLASIVSDAVPFSKSRKHPATKTFQAFRMQVNGELRQLEKALEATSELLADHGRLCVIAFHSLEDRPVKRFMRDASRESEQYRGMPDVPKEFRPTFRLIGKAISGTDAEIDANRRARSARLRVAERTRWN